MKMTAIQKWLSSLAATALAAAVAYAWLDRPISLYAYARLPQHATFETLTHIPDPFIPLALVIFVGIGLYALTGGRLTKVHVTALLCSVSVIVAEATKAQLKFLFGRTWPDTWISGNPSFIHDGAYGFNVLHVGTGYASFPSGHMSLTGAVVSVLWIAYPKGRPLYAAVILAVAIGLIGANYHFLSDIIAGSFVGVSTGWMTTALWQTRATAAARTSPL